jgi:hypothetical protein
MNSMEMPDVYYKDSLFYDAAITDTMTIIYVFQKFYESIFVLLKTK